MFPGGHPSKYYPDPTLLNFADRTRSGVFNVVWSLATNIGLPNNKYLAFISLGVKCMDDEV